MEGDGWLSLGSWLAKLEVHMQLSGFESGHVSKIQNGRHKLRSGQHTLALQQKYTKKYTKKNIL
jgi:hypothetical protein